MAFITGASSRSSQLIQSSGSEQDRGLIMDQRKRKRMVSNRESARRSRVKKQQHLDELSTQVSRLRAENGFILTNLNAATQMYFHAEAENSVLRAQVDELTRRLNSLTEIVEFMSSSSEGLGDDQMDDGDLFHPCNTMYVTQPILPYTDMFMI